jgi:hypothetical protein
MTNDEKIQSRPHRVFLLQLSNDLVLLVLREELEIGLQQALEFRIASQRSESRFKRAVPSLAWQ